MSMGVLIYRVTLFGGPLDGLVTACSHGIVIHCGELYVWTGGENKLRLDYVPDVMRSLSPHALVAERVAVEQWMKAPTKETTPDIPWWRIAAWIEIIRREIRI